MSMEEGRREENQEAGENNHVLLLFVFRCRMAKLVACSLASFSKAVHLMNFGDGKIRYGHYFRQEWTPLIRCDGFHVFGLMGNGARNGVCLVGGHLADSKRYNRWTRWAPRIHDSSLAEGVKQIPWVSYLYYFQECISMAFDVQRYQ